MHDEAMYPDPWAFNPDRYGNSADIENSINQDPRKVMFGFGRRCVQPSRAVYVPLRPG